MEEVYFPEFTGGHSGYQSIKAVPTLKDGKNEGGFLLREDTTARKKAETKLSSSEERFNLAMEASQDGIYDWDLETKKIYYSPGWKRMLGYEPEELPNDFSVWEKLTEPEDVASSWKMLNELIEGKRRRFVKEFKMRHKDGHWVDIFSRASLYRNPDDNRVRIVGTHVDITERKQSEQAINSLANNLKAIFDSAPNILALVDKDIRVEMINRKGVALVGESKENLYGLLCGDVFLCQYSFKSDGCGTNPECSDCPLRTRVLSTFETGKPHIEEEGQMTFLQNGKETPMDILISTSLLNTNGTKRVLLSLTDITGLKKAEEMLKESEMIHKEIFDNSPTPLYIQDFSETAECIKKFKDQNNVNDIKSYLQNNPDEVLHLASTVKILKSNKAARIMYQVDSKNDFLERLAPAIKPDDTQHFINQVVDFTDGKDWFEGEGRNLDAKGNVLDILLRKTVVNRAKNGLSKIIVSVTDVTKLHKSHREKAQLETRLQEAQKMESIGNLAGGIAHDFNNLLSPIIGISELLLEDLPPGSPQFEDVQEIFNAGKRGGELVKQILTFSRQGEHKKIPVRVQQIVKEVLKLSKSTIPAEIEIRDCLQPDCGLVMADPTQLHQIAMNLITNAYHAIQRNDGKIDIKVKEITLDVDNLVGKLQKPGKYALLSVSDNGIGIPSAHFEKIFEPYFTTKANGKGTGLGLSVVYGIVKEHHGEITVYSEVGKGTTFNVYLPLIKKNIELDSIKKPELLPTGDERVLVVDDEISLVKLEERILSQLGYTVIVRASSVDALEAFRNSPTSFDIVISDMSMPKMTGIQLAQEMRKIRPDIPIVICTGFSEHISQDIAKDIGVNGFLMKPIIRAELAQMVRKVLDKKYNLSTIDE
ncbi:MAG: PAS domain S-box protein [Pseudomonadota bacterium]